MSGRRSRATSDRAGGSRRCPGGAQVGFEQEPAAEDVERQVVADRSDLLGLDRSGGVDARARSPSAARVLAGSWRRTMRTMPCAQAHRILPGRAPSASACSSGAGGRHSSPRPPQVAEGQRRRRSRTSWPPAVPPAPGSFNRIRTHPIRRLFMAAIAVPRWAGGDRSSPIGRGRSGSIALLEVANRRRIRWPIAFSRHRLEPEDLYSNQLARTSEVMHRLNRDHQDGKSRSLAHNPPLTGS